MQKRSLVSALPLLLQIALVVGAVGAIALYPPREGAIALIALDGRDAGRLAGPAIAHGAQLIGRGPLANILIVRGRRDSLATDLLASGVVALAAPRNWCGARGARA